MLILFYYECMNKLTQKWCVVSLLDEATKGSAFLPRNWPLHVTLLPTFAVSASSSDLKSIFQQFTSKEKIITAAKADVQWGNITATLLNNHRQLQHLHESLIDSLKKHALVFNEPMFVGSNYKPHVTVQKSGRIYIGENVNITNIALVDMFPDNDGEKRRIIEIFKLGEDE
jgi:2'-5' RNA ligase